MWNNYSVCNIYVMEIPEGKEVVFEATIIDSVPKLMRHQITEPGISENLK